MPFGNASGAGARPTPPSFRPTYRLEALAPCLCPSVISSHPAWNIGDTVAQRGNCFIVVDRLGESHSGKKPAGTRLFLLQYACHMQLNCLWVTNMKRFAELLQKDLVGFGTGERGREHILHGPRERKGTWEDCQHGNADHVLQMDGLGLFREVKNNIWTWACDVDGYTKFVMRSLRRWRFSGGANVRAA